jgi:ABC-type transport system involved in multi-copper enzyme maturation permease subunit
MSTGVQRISEIWQNIRQKIDKVWYRLQQRFKMLIIAKKTFKDLTTTKKTLGILIVELIVPLILGLALTQTLPDDFSSRSVSAQTGAITTYFVIISFIWIAGIPLALYASSIGAGFIAKEQTEGTILILISKPIRRWEILIGKFLGFFINILIIQTISVYVSAWFLVLITTNNISVFTSMLPIINAVILYSIIVSLMFGSIAAALSSMTKSTGKIVMIMAALTMATYFGFFLIRALIGDYYEDYQIYHIDIGYHLANFYIMLLKALGIKISPQIAIILGVIGGTYKTEDVFTAFDDDQKLFKTPELAGYYPLYLSAILWIVVALALIFFGIKRLQKQDIV